MALSNCGKVKRNRSHSKSKGKRSLAGGTGETSARTMSVHQQVCRERRVDKRKNKGSLNNVLTYSRATRLPQSLSLESVGIAQHKDTSRRDAAD